MSRKVITPVCFVLLLVLTSADLVAQDDVSESKPGFQNESEIIKSVRLGFGGQCRLGFWVPVRIELSKQIPVDAEVFMTLPDTDGIDARIVAEWERERTPNGGLILRSIAKLGRSKGNLKIEIVTEPSGSQRKILSRQFSIADVCTPIESLREFYVSVGNGIELASGVSLGADSAYDAAIAVPIEDWSVLPNEWIGYESIDGLILETSQLEGSPLSEPVQTALKDWVRNGGRIVLVGGRNMQAVFQNNPVLASLVSGKPVTSRRLQSTSGLERTAKATVPLSDQRNRPFMTVFNSSSAEVLLEDIGAPIISSERFGFGQVLLMTVNLAEEPLASWSERKRLTAYLIALLNFSTQRNSEAKFRRSRFGYEDLSGQLRGALDSFADVSMVNFTIVAAIAILFILLIGPVDYFFLKKFVGRMEWTWLTFLLIVVGVSVVTVLVFRNAKPNRVIIRQVEVVDVDMKTKHVRGAIWSHIYSPSSKRYELTWEFGADTGLSQSEVYSSWQGFPGDALGGMQNNASLSNGSTVYDISLNDSSIVDMPINVASSKGVFARWTGVFDKGAKQELAFRRGLLRGRVVNPLNVDLDNVFVVYGRSAFLFKGVLAAGESFDVEADVVEKTISDYLNRRRLKDMGTEATPWNVTNTNMQRIMEIMMFYDKAGGQDYVNLLQRYQTEVDLSDVIGADSAVIVGRAKKPLHTMLLDQNSTADSYEEAWTYYRIVVPVAKKSNSNNN